MSAHVPGEDLEALALGELAPARAAEVEAHAAGCAECARELQWARTEQALFSRRSAEPAGALWAGVAARIGKETGKESRIHRPRWARRVVLAVATAAAAAVLIVALRPRSVSVPPDATASESNNAIADALATLDKAEADYHRAAAVLEAEYVNARKNLDPELARRCDETLSRARAGLGDARTMAAQDVGARLRVLDGYAGYLRSLRSVVQQSQEANP
jgi:anti-sigma factor RsiW